MRRLALATIFVATAASAQTTAPVGPDTGFFRPTPGNDPSLTNYLVPLTSPQQLQQAVQPPPPPQPPLPQAVVVPVPVPAAAPAPPPPQQVAEEQTDRAIREAEEARARAAAGTVVAPIVGAFTGQTNERDR